MNPPNKSTTVFPQTEEIPVPLEIHPSVSPLAAELLMKVAEILALHPNLYNQHKTNPMYDCGAPCCIIGHMRTCNGYKPGNGANQRKAAFIGLTEDQFDRIFEVTLWPIRLSFDISAADGVARIEHMLKTGQ